MCGQYDDPSGYAPQGYYDPIETADGSIVDYDDPRKGTTMDEKYNGWTNWETWATHLWLSNEESAYHGAVDIAARETQALGREGASRVAEDEMREYAEEMIFGEEAPASLGTDLIMHSLAQVNWREVVEAFRD